MIWCQATVLTSCTLPAEDSPARFMLLVVLGGCFSVS